MDFVTYEDREEGFFGIQLLLLSLSRFSCPSTTLSVFCGKRGFPGWFFEWLNTTSLALQVELHTLNETESSGWNVKPTVLLRLLSQGRSPITWLDSDLIATSAVGNLFGQWPDDLLVLGSERGVSDKRRCEFFDLVYRAGLPSSPNSCVIRVTRDHEPLLRVWEELLCSSSYREIAAMPYKSRPSFMIGDQDVLTAILESSLLPELDRRSIAFLDWQRSILHSATFGIRRALFQTLAGPPVFVHAQGQKPWWIHLSRPCRFSDVSVELSPYLAHAHQYRHLIGSAERSEWAYWRSSRGGACRLLTGNHRYLRYIPHVLPSRSLKLISRLPERFFSKAKA